MAGTDTQDLIDRLAGALAPVRRLPAPGWRLARWLAVSVPAAAAVALGYGLRPNLPALLAQPVFVLELAAAALTALAAAYAALCAVVPDQPGWKLLLPVAPLALWLGTLGQQCIAVALHVGPAGLVVTQDWMCLPAIALGGAVPAVAIVALLRRSRGVRTGVACVCGALAAAALGAAALRLYHPQDAAVMVLIWQAGSVALLSLLGGGVLRLAAPTGRAA